MNIGYMNSVFGRIKISVDNESLIGVEFVDDQIDTMGSSDHSIINDTIHQLEEYLAGTRTMFDLPLKLSGTEFQQSVLKEVINIPYGKTVSYGMISLNLGDKNLVRAVGSANGNNSLLIIVPCYRVIGSTGNLVGYAGGIDRKRSLLNFERDMLFRQKSLF